MTADDLYDKLVEEGLFTEEELALVTNINGFMVETLNECIFARYGYRSYEQMKGEEE